MDTGRQGFTFIEIIIALAVTAILMGGVYGLYFTFYKQTTAVNVVIGTQQNARAGISFLEKKLLLIGHSVDASAEIITIADTDEVEFKYMDPDTFVNYKASFYVNQANNTLVYAQCEEASDWSGSCSYVDSPDVIGGLNENVTGQGLEFTYFDENGESVTAPITTTENRAKIRFIKIKLTVITEKALASTGERESVVATVEVNVRNLYVLSAGGDTTIPSMPTNLYVVEATTGTREGVCGQLELMWTQNTDGDLAYFRVYFSEGSNENNVKVSVSDTTVSGGHHYYTLAPGYGDGDWMLKHSADYTISVRAFDNSNNASLSSPEITNQTPETLAGSVYEFGGINDTFINPSPPEAWTAGMVSELFSGSDGASDSEVVLSWDYDITDNNPDTTSFRVYRSTTPFSDFPLTGGNADWIAGEDAGGGRDVLVASDTTYSDPDTKIGCRVYYYAIAPVNCGGDSTYTESNYAITFGDGSEGEAADSPTGSDTAPPDTVAPYAPSIGVRAGWKRVAVTLTQSASEDLDQTCMYAAQSVDPPELSITNPPAGLMGCYEPESTLLSDSEGVWTKAELGLSASDVFWHDSMDEETPSVPSLLEIGTYSYEAVTFDLCGNGSELTDAQATTQLCGEDPKITDYPLNNFNHPKPPAVTDLAVTCCEGGSPGVQLTWTEVGSNIAMTSTPDNPYDLAGYRIFRSSNEAFTDDVSLLNTGAPLWGNAISDTTAQDGETWYYRVASTDCMYEKLNPSASIIESNMMSNIIHSIQIGPVTPGVIERDEKCEDDTSPVDESCTMDNQREILTGVNIDNSAGNGFGTAELDSNDTFYHNKVTKFFRNTSAGTMTIEGATVSWVNSEAFLRSITIGGGRSGMGEITTGIGTNPTSITPSGGDPYTRTLADLTLTSSQVPAGARYVPVTFEFKDSVNTEDIDMREDEIRITLNVTNDSTGTTSCESYLTISEDLEGIFIPLGPTISQAQQDQPESPTFGYAVPGPTGNNTVVSGAYGPISADAGLPVEVSAVIASNTISSETGYRININNVAVYYAVTNITVTDSPDRTSFSGEVLMDDGDDGNGVGCNLDGSIQASVTCFATIPAESDKRIWYVIVAQDDEGNFDIDPEPNDGVYVYDQKPFDVCDVTPNAPTDLAIDAVTGPDVDSLYDVDLSWIAPTEYTNGITIVVGDTIRYRVFRDGIAVGNTGDLVFTDTGLVGGTSYVYTVKALNSCSPMANRSDDSEPAATCVGASSQADMSVFPSTIQEGDSYTVYILDCLALSTLGGPTDHGFHTDYINTTNDISSDYGSFTNTSTGTGAVYTPILEETSAASGSFTSTVQTAVDGSADLLITGPDTITVNYRWAGTQIVTVTADPCVSTPGTPGTLTGTTQGHSVVKLTWGAITQNDDGSAIEDLAGYKIWEQVNGGAWEFIATTDAATTTKTFTVSSGRLNTKTYSYLVIGVDTCSPPNEGDESNIWTESR